MNKLITILFLISLTELFSVWGIDANYFLNYKEKSKFEYSIYSSLYPLHKSKHSIGAGFKINHEADYIVTAEYNYVNKSDGFVAFYKTLEIGYTSNDQLYLGFNHTLNVFIFNLRINYINLKLSNDHKPVIGCGLGIGFGGQHSIYDPENNRNRKKR